jgi:hypothetical protein
MRWIRPSSRLIFSLGLSFLALPLYANERVMFACGTPPGAGAFYSDTAEVQCASGSVSTDPSQPQIFCSFTATCTPLTARLRLYIEQQNPGKKFDQLSDTEISNTIMRGAGSGAMGFQPEVTFMNVQCLGRKNASGAPECPSVNECVNSRTAGSARHWALRPLPQQQHSGFRVQQDGVQSPQGVSR